jgi:hypothetical protein
MESGGIFTSVRTAALTSMRRRRRRPVVESRRMSTCQHTDCLSLVREFRRTLSGRAEPDGKSIVCGSCGDRWRFMDRVQLPEWLRAELIRRRLC